MRCPVCVRNSCTCSPGDWDRELRRSFNAAAKWARAARAKDDASDAELGPGNPSNPALEKNP